MKKSLSILALLLLFILNGCSLSFLNSSGADGSSNGGGNGDVVAYSSPTVANVFSPYYTMTPKPTRTPTVDLSGFATPTIDAGLVVSETPAETAATAAPEPTGDIYQYITIYEDELAKNWTLRTNPGLEVEMSDTTHVHSGKYSIAITPKADFRMFYLIVSPTTKEKYSRDEVVGVKFWLNGGANEIKTSDLAVAVLGSNDFAFWMADDKSVFKAIPGGTFSETRLYDLQFNKSIPPNTWVEVYVNVDKLVFDPPYQYITGFYIKNDAGFKQTYYIDDVSLFTVPANSPLSGSRTPDPTNLAKTPKAGTTTPQATQAQK
jgi:hypothetical protein